MTRILLVANAVGITLLLIATTRQSFPVFALLYVFGFGFNNALTYMVPIHHAWLWFPERPGLVSGILISGFGIGALIFNTVCLYLVNPQNESSDESGRFSAEINSRLPFTLRVVITCFFFMTLVAITLISPGPA